jgi:hypothetical protein
VVNFSLNNSFVKNLEITDYVGFAKQNRAIGFNLGCLLAYQTSKRTSLMLGLVNIGMYKTKFRYYGQTHSTVSLNPEIPLIFKYNLKNNISMNMGVNLAFQLYDGLYYLESEPIGYNFKNSVAINSISVINPILTFGISKFHTFQNGRFLELVFAYNQGTKVYQNYTLKLENPALTSTFNTNASNISLQIRWYLKRNKNKEIAQKE